MRDFKIENGILTKYYGSDENLLIPDGVKIIGEDCFEEYKFIKSVTVPESVVEIQSYAFSRCTALKTLNFAPKGGLEVIGEKAFCECGIEELVFPPSLRQIHDSAFFSLEKLKKLILNDGLSFIGGSAFEACRKLSEVFIPASVKRIEWFGFAIGEHLTVYAEAPKKPLGWHEWWNDVDFVCKVVWGSKRRNYKMNI